MSIQTQSVMTATASINLAALKYNLAQIKQQAPNSQVIAVCKANGYGHGLIQVAHALTDADAFGVARMQEAIALRNADIKAKVLLLEGVYCANELATLVDYQIDTVVHCAEQLEAIEKANLAKPIDIWLKVDTGMSRLGITPERLGEYIDRLKQCANVDKIVGIMTHFACADETSNPMTSQQIELFEAICQPYQVPLSFANSAAVINFPHSQQDWIRPGLLLYGVSPNPYPDNKINLKPVMTLKSRLIAIKDISAGSSVGYGATWCATEDTKLGIVAIGYGDGYPRHARNGTPAWLNGRRVNLVGRVSMDMIAVDLGTDNQDRYGDEVELWGESLSVAEVANYADTIPYQLLCGLTSRVELEYS